MAFVVVSTRPGYHHAKYQLTLPLFYNSSLIQWEFYKISLQFKTIFINFSLWFFFFQKKTTIYFFPARKKKLLFSNGEKQECHTSAICKEFWVLFRSFTSAPMEIPVPSPPQMNLTLLPHLLFSINVSNILINFILPFF